MPHKTLPHNAPCPCGSGKKYGDCCRKKSFEYLVDNSGNIYRSIEKYEGRQEFDEVPDDSENEWF